MNIFEQVKSGTYQPNVDWSDMRTASRQSHKPAEHQKTIYGLNRRNDERIAIHKASRMRDAVEQIEADDE